MGPPGRERDAFERAVEALARKERTAAELVAWLIGRGYAEAEAAAAVERLTEIGEVDDERFARRYVDDKRELAGWGGERIRAALRDRGLDEELIERALGGSAADTPDTGARRAAARASELDRAIWLLGRRGETLGDEPARGRALSFLARRGYELEIAYEAVRRYERSSAAAPGA